MKFGAALSDYFHVETTPRAELLVRAICLIFAFDAWANPLQHAGRYGFGQFNVPHATFLDWLYPMPSPSMYSAAVVLASFAALSVTILGPRLWNTLALALSWGFAWSMAYIDGYQHHYYLFLLFVCFVGIPRAPAEPGTGKKSWGFPLLCATTANMYFWAGVAKLNAHWLDGTRVADIFGKRGAPLEAAVQVIGLSPSAMYIGFAWGTVVLEVLLLLAYLLVPMPRTRTIQRWLYVALVLALSLHVGAELLGLKIKWFSYYMITMSLLCLGPPQLPDRVAAWLRIGGLTAWPDLPGKTWMWVGASSLAVLGFMLPSDMPGMVFVGGLVALVTVALGLSRQPFARGFAVSMALAAAGFAFTIDVFETRYDYWRFVGAAAHRSAKATPDRALKVERLETALDAYLRADRHAPEGTSREKAIGVVTRALEKARR